MDLNFESILFALQYQQLVINFADLIMAFRRTYHAFNNIIHGLWPKTPQSKKALAAGICALCGVAAARKTMRNKHSFVEYGICKELDAASVNAADVSVEEESEPKVRICMVTHSCLVAQVRISIETPAYVTISFVGHTCVSETCQLS